MHINTNIHKHAHTHTYTYIAIYLYLSIHPFTQTDPLFIKQIRMYTRMR